MTTTYAKCPDCGSKEMTAVTYAYHRVVDRGYGLELQFEETDDAYAIECMDCGWAFGDTGHPAEVSSLERSGVLISLQGGEN